MSRPDLLDVLPYADVADRDPNALPFGDDPCEACGADTGQPCYPLCIGQAAAADECASHYYRRNDQGAWVCADCGHES